MQDMFERLKTGVLIADGAMGTMLQEQGLAAGQAPEEWNLSHPEVMGRIHRDYIRAGAEMIVTNTFGANRIKLKKAGLDDKTEETNTEAVRTAGRAAEATGGKTYVAGDMGPTGEFMEPLGLFSRDDFLMAFREQAVYLVGAGVDLFIIETMTDIEELLCALEAIGQVSSKPVVACMSFEPAGEDYRTMMGVSPVDMAGRLSGSACRIMGLNCGLVASQMKEAVSSLREKTKGLRETELFLLAKPNAGHPKLTAGRTIFEQSPKEFADDAAELVRAGVNIIGGCCGTTPEHIKELSHRVAHLKYFSQ